jgi:D-glycero-D-manno-heptose 1,7-bisphosphate phosphatase
VVNDAQLVDGLGLWFERRCTDPSPRRPAVFLDRDGVIVEETHYLGRAEDVRMIPGAAAAVAQANRAGYAVVVVTNQAGIGRGYHSWDGFVSVQNRICEELSASGAHFDAVLACAYHEQGVGAFARPNHPWRKPNPGMIQAAGNALNLDLGRSIIIGDKASDIEAGFRAGLGLGVLVESGYGLTERAYLTGALSASMEVETAHDIGAAIRRLTMRP